MAQGITLGFTADAYTWKDAQALIAAISDKLPLPLHINLETGCEPELLSVLDIAGYQVMGAERLSAHSDMLIGTTQASAAFFNQAICTIALQLPQQPQAAVPEQLGSAFVVPTASVDYAANFIAFLAQRPLWRLASHRDSSASAAPQNEKWLMQGLFDSSYSLAIVNKELACALNATRPADAGEALGVHQDTYLERTPDWHYLTDKPECEAMFERASTWLAQGDKVDVRLHNHYPIPFPATPTATVDVLANYAWEETGFPDESVEDINSRATLVTAVSPFVKRILRNAGVRTPIAVVGNGVDHMQHTVAQPMAITLGGGRRFLHVSSCFPRKGVDILLQSFITAFDADDDVTLIIKTFPNPHNDVEQQLRDYLQGIARPPRIQVINQDISSSELAWLYQQCDVFVTAPRAEGFGLPIAEAALYGLPTLTTDWGGHSILQDEDADYRIQSQIEFASSHLSLYYSTWAEPEQDHLTLCLQQLAQKSDKELALRATRQKERLLQNFSWQQVAQRTRKAVQQVRTSSPDQAGCQVTVLSTWNSKCGIAAYSQSLFSTLAEERLLVLANSDAQPVNQDKPYVKRVWRKGSLSVEPVLQAIAEQGSKLLSVQWHPGFADIDSIITLLEQAENRGVKCFLTLHNSIDFIKQADAADTAQIYAVLKQVTRIIVHSIHDINRFKATGLVDNLMLTPIGVPDEGEWLQLAPIKPRTEDVTLFGTFGFLMPHKGFDVLLKAFATLGEDSHLLMLTSTYAGSHAADYEQEIRHLIHTLGLEQRVTLETRYLDEGLILRSLNECDALVYPYQYTAESASAAVRMGIGSGTIPLVTPLSIFDDIKDISVVSAGTDQNALADSMQYVIDQFSDPEARQRIYAPLESCRKFCRWERLSRKFVSIIDGETQDIFTDELIEL